MAHSTADKNFRLSKSIKPTRYLPTVTLDLERRTFEGKGQIELNLSAPAQEIILHAVELELFEVTLKRGSEAWAPRAVRMEPLSGTAVLEFAAPVAEGPATLELSWRGKFSRGLRGLYLAGGIAGTQFEAADARRMFPCFDEPEFKARWTLTARVPRELTVLSNGDPVAEVAEGPLKKVTFQETEVLSSYLIALVCGPLVAPLAEKSGETWVRTFATAEKIQLAHFGQKIALAALPRLQAYFGIPYAFGKVDQVALPEFEAGAMENAGLVTFRETALLLDPKTAPLPVQKRIAEIITHELAHQWFGNWVTMAWWDDLWLNEAFATWMACKIMQDVEPKWRMWLSFNEGTAAALHLDALRSTHPIRSEIANAEDAGEAFDLITYEKGGAVLRMIERFLGEGPFRDGIRHYMVKHGRGNTVADDLWGALADASSQPVLEVANAWIRKSGFPVISVSVQGASVSVAQRRFYSEPGVCSEETWPVPLVLRFADEQGVHERPVLLKEAASVIALDRAPTWLCANGGAAGFYRVQYDARALAALAKNLPALEPSERICLIADEWALVRAGTVEMAEFLDLIPQFGAEEDDAVLSELVGRLALIEARILDGEPQRRLQELSRRLFAGPWMRAGWDAGRSEEDGTKLRRAALLRAVGGVGRDAAVVSEAHRRVMRMMNGDDTALDANLLDSAVGLAARGGDATLFKRLCDELGKTNEPSTKRRYLGALTAFETPALTQTAFDFFFAGKVPVQDTATFLGGLLHNRGTRDAFWGQMRVRWPEIQERIGQAPMILRRCLEALTSLRTRPQLQEVRTFLRDVATPEMKHTVAQTLEKLEQDVNFRERVAPSVESWLKGASI